MARFRHSLLRLCLGIPVTDRSKVAGILLRATVFWVECFVIQTNVKKPALSVLWPLVRIMKNLLLQAIGFSVL